MLLGKRIRHFRTQAGLTLDALGERVGVVGSQLSLIENGRREPRLSLLQAIARELNVDPAELLRQEAPDARSAMELELERAQHSPAYLQLKLPHVRTPKTLSDEALESLIGLHRELARRSLAAAATPEEARRANTAIRLNASSAIGLAWAAFRSKNFRRACARQASSVTPLANNAL